MTEEHTFDSHMERGREFIQAGYLEQALEQFQHASLLNPGHKRAIYGCAFCSVGLSRWSDALATLETLGPMLYGTSPANTDPELSALRVFWLAHHQNSDIGWIDLPSALSGL